MYKKIFSGEEAKLKILKGVETLANAVKITLGPKGRNVIIGDDAGSPYITNDGVTIAREIQLKDEVENNAVELLREATIKTNDYAGDGTTTATLLAERIFSEGLKTCNMGANPILLRDGIKKAVKFVIKEIKQQAKKIEDNNAIKQIAKISAGSEETGTLFAKAYELVGKDGVILIEEGKNLIDSLNVVEGVRINRGYISPYMCDDQIRLIAELEDPYIFITDKKISHINEILPVMEKVNKANGSLVIVADDVEGDALTTIVINNMRKVFRCLAIKAPNYGDRRKKVLDDLALTVGGKFISTDVYNNFNDVQLEDLGRATKVKADKDIATIVGAKGNKSLIENRISELKESLKTVKSAFDKETILSRIAMLNGGIAVIKVGAASEMEMKEKKLRMEDALNATQSAIEEGVIVGGGVALLRTKSKLKEFVENLSGDEKIGATIVLNCLDAPIRQIAKNAGVDDGVVVDKILSNKNLNYGYDALNDKFCDMFAAGIIDPVKVTRTALESAGSVASTLLTTECVVAKIVEEKDIRNLR